MGRRPDMPKEVDALIREVYADGGPTAVAERLTLDQRELIGLRRIRNRAARLGIKRNQPKYPPMSEHEDNVIRDWYEDNGAKAVAIILAPYWKDNGIPPRHLKSITNRASQLRLKRTKSSLTKIYQVRLSYARPAGIDDLLGLVQL